MRMPILLLLIALAAPDLIGWDCIHGQSTIEKDRIHLAVDSLVIKRVPFVVTCTGTGGKDVCHVRLHIHNTRVTLKHTMEADGPIRAFGFLALGCEVEVTDIETEVE